MNLVIRPIDPADRFIVKDIISACAVEFNLLGEGFGPSDPEIDNMFKAYQGSRSLYLVCEINGKVLGGGRHRSFKGRGRALV